MLAVELAEDTTSIVTCSKGRQSHAVDPGEEACVGRPVVLEDATPVVMQSKGKRSQGVDPGEEAYVGRHVKHSRSAKLAHYKISPFASPSIMVKKLLRPPQKEMASSLHHQHILWPITAIPFMVCPYFDATQLFCSST